MDRPVPDKSVQNPFTTRLAPSPTGALHLGNARTFLINWALARQHGWRILLRIEDLDTPRIKPGVIDQTINTLTWLGLNWHEQTPLQSADMAPYADAMTRLAHAGLVYPCTLTRAQIESAASAPNEGDHEQRFAAALRPEAFTPGQPRPFDDRTTNWRLAVEPGVVRFEDRIAGTQIHNVAGDVGDFVVWTKRGQPSYQLAVVIDDAAGGITDVVRGDDLLASTARQILLSRALGLEGLPTFWHLPLVRGEDGRRLAKRHGDTRIEHYRAHGVPPERVVGLMAWWSGVTDRPEPMPAEEFAERFKLDTMPRHDITFREADDRWLVSQ